MTVLRSASLLSVVLALSIETLHAQRPTDLVNKHFVADVTRVADGDTVEVLMPPARKVRIRLHGVDTPEAKEPFSNQARTFTRVLMFGRRVTVVGKDVDRYDRLVARITVDNVDASESIIAAGLGCTFRQYVMDPALESALARARNSQRGFWAAGAAKPACVAREAKRTSAAPLPHARPGLAHEKLRVGALARRVLLDSAGPYFSGVEIALFVGREPVHAPLTALARAERSP